MHLSTKHLALIAQCAGLLATPFPATARAADMLQFSYTGLNSNYFNTTLFLNGQPATTGDVTKLDGGVTNAHLAFAGATASHSLTFHLTSITPNAASSTGTLVIIDLDGDEFTADVSGTWVNNGTTADFTGVLTDVQPKPCLGDGVFNGTSGAFPMSFSEPAPFTGPFTVSLAIGSSANWFTTASFFGIAGTDNAHLVSGGGGEPVGPIQITAWKSVRSHSAAGALAIALDPAAVGNGPSGPIVEPRSGGIQRIEVTFSRPVTLTATPAAGIRVVGRTTSYAGHSAILGSPVTYTPTSVTSAGTHTLAINFSPGLLPDDSCYELSIGAGAINETITGDSDCSIRSLYADATGDGLVNLSDAVVALLKTTGCVSPAPRFDLNLSGTTGIPDALAAKARIASPSHQALCP